MHFSKFQQVNLTGRIRLRAYVFLFADHFDCVHQGVVHDRYEIEVDLTLGRSWYSVERSYYRAVSNAARLLQNVEAFQQGHAIAIDIENPATLAAIRIGRSEPAFGEMHDHRVFAPLHYRNQVIEMAVALRLIQRGIGGSVDRNYTGGFAATRGIMIWQP